MSEQTTPLEASVGDFQPTVAPEPDANVSRRIPAKKQLVTTISLTIDACRWPFGDPATPDFHYCGEPPLVEGPYCNMHNSKAYHPMRGKTTATSPDLPADPASVHSARNELMARRNDRGLISVQL